MCIMVSVCVCTYIHIWCGKCLFYHYDLLEVSYINFENINHLEQVKAGPPSTTQCSPVSQSTGCHSCLSTPHPSETTSRRQTSLGRVFSPWESVSATPYMPPTGRAHTPGRAPATRHPVRNMEQASLRGAMRALTAQEEEP